MLMRALRTTYGLARLIGRLGLRGNAAPAAGPSVAQRLQAIPPRAAPLAAPVRIRWNRHHVPFIEAQHDTDLAVALGMVHAHLRLGQIEIMRWIAEGRLASVVGPAAIDFDHLLRVLDFARAADGIVDALPDGTRAWVDGFAAGLNCYIERMPAPPPDLAALGVDPRPWSTRDVLVLMRLTGADFNWKVWIRMLKLRGRPDWPQLWQRLVGGGLPVPGFSGSSPGGGALDRLLGAVDRSGSNCVAVAGHKSAGGGALIAGDPHLSFVLPNTWLVAGYRSPGHHAVGLMIPGVPLMALGRNPWAGWGGTSLHAASSDLFDVTDLPPDRITLRRERIAVRWGADRDITVRETPYGPILTDARLLGAPRDRRLALHWIGHRVSDEITAMLAVNRARTWEEFLAAIEGFAVPAQNLVYADRTGRVGIAMAARLPRRPPGPPPDLALALHAHDHWRDVVTAKDLPHTVDPPEGFVASANNAPPAGPVAVGYFFSPEDRVGRLRQVLSHARPVTTETLADLQRDVHLASGTGLRDLVLRLVREAGLDLPAGDPRARLVAAVEGWDGSYPEGSRGALAFELLAYHLIAALHGRRSLQVYQAVYDPWMLLRDDLDRAPRARLGRAGRAALARAAREFHRLGTWGQAHRLRLAHPLGAVPFAGRRYRFADLPVGGSNETVMKTAHGLAGGRHGVRFGANARHISDLADPDDNRFVLLGGQDGWLGSTTFLDQLALWRSGTYVRVPLTPGAVAAEFEHVTDIAPD